MSKSLRARRPGHDSVDPWDPATSQGRRAATLRWLLPLVLRPGRRPPLPPRCGCAGPRRRHWRPSPAWRCWCRPCCCRCTCWGGNGAACATRCAASPTTWTPTLARRGAPAARGPAGRALGLRRAGQRRGNRARRIRAPLAGAGRAVGRLVLGDRPPAPAELAVWRGAAGAGSRVWTPAALLGRRYRPDRPVPRARAGLGRAARPHGAARSLPRHRVPGRRAGPAAALDLDQRAAAARRPGHGDRLRRRGPRRDRAAPGARAAAGQRATLVDDGAAGRRLVLADRRRAPAAAAGRRAAAAHRRRD